MMVGPQCAVETRTSSVSDENDNNMMSAAAAAVKPMKRNKGDDEPMNSSSSTAASLSTSVHNTALKINEEEERSGPVHFCFIVHGHQGKPTDLSYLHHTIKDKANQYGGFATTKSSESCSVGSNNGSQNDVTARREKRDRWLILLNRRRSDEGEINQTRSVENCIIGESKGTLIVHNAACNEGTTHDGVEKGGERLANEMLEVIRSELDKQRIHKSKHDVTISIVGNSLGGLYGRYAIAKLDQLLQISEEDDNKDVPRQHYILDNNIRIHFNVFCSTASPHLGCADRTYFPIPRFAEIGIAKGLGETGRDLFRMNGLMRTMATSPKFTRPLALFRKRIAYANAYGTDFVVPGSTAAFLDGNSDSLHYFDTHYESEGRDEEKRSKLQSAGRVCPASEKGLFVATCYTPRLPVSSPPEAENELEVMSKSLDSLGWTKVFVDIRREIPISATLPRMSNSSRNECPIRRLSSNCKAVSSKDLCNAISSAHGNHISLPFGHNAICAFERGSFSTTFNKGGRPVMDSLAINLVEDISTWTTNRYQV
jgi:hypothetical protein